MDFLWTLIDHLKWPLVTFVLGWIFIKAIKEPIGKFFGRATRLSKDGIEVSPQSQETRAAVTSSSTEALEKVFDNALLIKQETAVRTELEKHNVSPGADRERILTRYYASVSLALAFERIYAGIWGSQVSVLQFLNPSPAGLNVEQLRPWYKQAATQNPAAYENYTFDQWLGFLLHYSLITHDNQRVTITLEGKEFLKYLIDQGKTAYKAF